MLSKDEETALFKEYKSSKTSVARKEEIRTHILRANLRFAFKEAKKFSKNDPRVFEELILAANDGLLAGFEKFDPSKGYRFLSYAGWWVQQRILKEMSKMRLVSLPIWKQQLASKINKFQETKPDITLEELKKLLPGVSEKDIKELMETNYLTYYIDDMDENDFEVDVIGGEVQQRMDNERVWKAVSALDSPYREIIARSFGLEDGDEKTPAEIAKALKLPKEEIKRLKTEGLKMLKDVLGKKEAYLDH